MLNESYVLSNVNWSNFSPTDFNPTDFTTFIPPPMPPNVSIALGPLTDSQVVDDLFVDLLPWLEVFPDGYIQNNTYLSNLVGREAEIQALDLAAYNRSIAKEFGMSWQDYQSRIIELRSQQQSFSPLEEQNTQGGYDDYTNGSWSAYDVNPNTGLTGNSNQIGAAQIGRYFVQTGAPYDPTPNNGIVNVTVPGYWVPLGGGAQTRGSYPTGGQNGLYHTVVGPAEEYENAIRNLMNFAPITGLATMVGTSKTLFPTSPLLRLSIAPIPPLTINSTQLGVKFAAHAFDLGIGAGGTRAVEFYRYLANFIRDDPQRVRVGTHSGQTQPVWFFERQGIVVVVKQDGSFVSMYNLYPPQPNSSWSYATPLPGSQPGESPI
jgi:hypothetical protein